MPAYYPDFFMINAVVGNKQVCLQHLPNKCLQNALNGRFFSFSVTLLCLSRRPGVFLGTSTRLDSILHETSYHVLICFVLFELLCYAKADVYIILASSIFISSAEKSHR